METRKLNLPQRDDKRLKKVLNYLERMGLSKETIQQVYNEGLIYSDKNGNAIFENYAHSAAEVKGTEQKSRFMQTYRLDPDRFWYINKTGYRIYICTSATDALALFEMRKENAIFASCSGSNNYQIIERIIKSGRDVVLALDNSPTSDKAREKYPETEKLKHLKPNAKTWVEDLQNQKGLR